jgi:hypothetical protein
MKIKSVFGGHTVVVSEVKNKLRRLNTEWSNYKKYNKDNLYNEDILLPLITKLFGISSSSVEGAINTINTIFSSDPTAAMDEIFELSHSVKMFLKDIFFLWRDFIEKHMIFILGHKPTFEDIDSSSPLIYFLAADRNKYQELRGHFKHIDYDYTGYCDTKVEERLIHLLEFPINGLFKLMPDSAAEMCKKIYEIRLPRWDPPQEMLLLKSITCDNIIECIDHLINYFDTMDEWLEGREEYFLDCSKIFEEVAKIIKQELE